MSKHDIAIMVWVESHTRPCRGVSGFVMIEEEELKSLLRIYYNLSDILEDVKKVRRS